MASSASRSPTRWTAVPCHSDSLFCRLSSAARLTCLFEIETEKTERNLTARNGSQGMREDWPQKKHKTRKRNRRFSMGRTRWLLEGRTSSCDVVWRFPAPRREGDQSGGEQKNVNQHEAPVGWAGMAHRLDPGLLFKPIPKSRQHKCGNHCDWRSEERAHNENQNCRSLFHVLRLRPAELATLQSQILGVFALNLDAITCQDPAKSPASDNNRRNQPLARTPRQRRCRPARRP